MKAPAAKRQILELTIIFLFPCRLEFAHFITANYLTPLNHTVNGGGWRV